MRLQPYLMRELIFGDIIRSHAGPGDLPVPFAD
jgi:hypothetical protein